MRRADGSPIHVLVVDDEPVLAELVSMALRYEGWEARTHTPPGTAVTTSLAVGDDAGVVLAVLDDGPGIPAGLQPGLAIVDAVVRAHGGAIELDSVPGRTEFVVRLPGAGVSSADSGRGSDRP